MKYRNLGKWGLKVSEIALGSWMTDLNGVPPKKLLKQQLKRHLTWV